MSTTDRSMMVVALFTDENQAQQAVDALLNAGFDSNQISFAGHGTPRGLLAGLKSFFTGEAMSTGGAYNDLVSRGMTEQDAQYYQQEFEAGRSVVAVSGDRLQEASTILSTYGGYGASQRGTGYDTTQQSMTGTEGQQRVHLREEQLQAYKQPVETGSVGLHKEVVSEQQSVDVPVTHEEVYIERRPGTGQPSDAPIGDEETYRVPVRDEQVATSKQTVDRGEIAVGKRQVQGTQRVTDTVRREEARVDRQGDVNVQGSDTEVETDQ